MEHESPEDRSPKFARGGRVKGVGTEPIAIVSGCDYIISASEVKKFGYSSTSEFLKNLEGGDSDG